MHRIQLMSFAFTLGALGGLAACSDHDHAASPGPDAAPDAGDAGSPAPEKLLTLDGKQPLVIGHRGFPGVRPEETQPSYELAADFGADALEEDLHLTKDCVLVARHNPWLSDNTDIATVAMTNAEFAARKRTVPGVSVPVKWTTTPATGPSSYLVDLTNPSDPSSVLNSLVVDGEEHVNDWSINDFTAAELTTQIHGTTYDAAADRPAEYNGLFPVLTFQQIIDIAKAKAAARNRVISVYPETKNPTWNDEQAIAHGCGAPGSHPLEDALIKILDDNNLNTHDSPVFVQSFEPTSLQYMHDHGLKTKIVQLIDAYDTDFKTGTVVYNEITDSRPYDWTVAGDSRWFDAMLTPDGLATIKQYADGIGPWKPMILPLKITPFPATGTDGKPYSGSTTMAQTLPPTSVITDAHKAGLFVHIFTFRNEPNYLAGTYDGDPEAEYLKFFRLGVDGVFTDFTSTAATARTAFVAEINGAP
jgi:glycerophosphoryl diester phosphodiesterase